MGGIDWDADVLAPVMAVFGDAVTYRPRNAAAFTLPDAVFDAQYGIVEVDTQTGVSTTSRMPALGVRASLFPAPPQQNDMVDVRQATPPAQYVVKNVQPDSHGHILLLLAKRADL